MAPRTTKPVEPDVELDEDDCWMELVTENTIPPMKIRGLVLEQPTASAVEAWDASGQSDDKLLFGDKADAIQALFADQPASVKRNFYTKYMKHMFGTEGDSLKG